MKKLIILALSLVVSYGLFAQEPTVQPEPVVKEEVKGYEFTVVKENPISSIKNQASSGTCWSYSALSFIESDLMRRGKGEHDLSAIYVSRRNYADKATKYVRLHGFLNFSQGGSFADAISTINEYGVIPTESYKGLNYGEPLNKHGEVDAVMTGYLKGVVENKNGKLSTAWNRGFEGILDAYFGEIPTEFTYQGKKHSAQSLAKDLGLNSDDYISFTSFTHQPFYTEFAIEIQDNWRWTMSYNIPIDEMMQLMDYAIDKGHTVAWATDVSEIGFTRNGVAVIPDEAAPENAGSDQAHWLGLSPAARIKELKDKVDTQPMKEKAITQEMRQVAYDNYETTDDHGMQIYGVAKDRNGTEYYMVKNSWGEAGKYKGLWYASKTFAKYKTLSIMIHKDAIPKELAKKLNIK